MLMEKKSNKTIPGTIVNSQNGHLMISSGIGSLDTLLGNYLRLLQGFLCSKKNVCISGGGIPVGTVVLIGEYYF